MANTCTRSAQNEPLVLYIHAAPAKYINMSEDGNLMRTGEMQFEAHTDLPPAGWDNTISLLDANHFQAAAWVAYRKGLSGSKPIFFLCRDKNEAPSAAAVGYVEQSNHMGLRHLSRKLVFDSHPVFNSASSDSVLSFLAYIEDYARSAGCVSIAMGSFFSGESRLPLAETGFSEKRRIEFHFALQDPIDTLWNRVAKEQREKIRRAEKKNVEVKIASGLGELLALRELQAATKERREEMGQGYDLDIDDQRYRQLSEVLGKSGLLVLFMAYLEGEAISGILFGSFNRRAYSIFSGSNAVGYKLSTPSLLFWRAVQHFRESDFILLNRGGVPYESQNDTHPAHGIYFYKGRLGAVPLVCIGGKKIMSSFRHQAYSCLERYVLPIFKDRIGSGQSTK